MFPHAPQLTWQILQNCFLVILTLTLWWGRLLVLFSFLETVTWFEVDFISYLYFYMKLFLMGMWLDDFTSYPKANSAVSCSIKSVMIYFFLRFLHSMVIPNNPQFMWTFSFFWYMLSLSCQLEFLPWHFCPQGQASSTKETIENSLEGPRNTGHSNLLSTCSRALSSAKSGYANPHPVWAPLSTPPLWGLQRVHAGSFWSLRTTPPCFLLLVFPGTHCSHWSFIYLLGCVEITCHWIWLRMMIICFSLFFQWSAFFF